MMNRNNTTLFLLRALKISETTLSQQGFINAYLTDEIHEIKHENCLYLLFRSRHQHILGDFIANRNERIVDDYDYPYEDGVFTVVVFRFPEEYKENYDLFKDGKYSKFTDAYKALFPRAMTTWEKVEGLDKEHIYGKWPSRDKSLLYLIVHKHPEMKEYLEEYYEMKFLPDMEYYSKPDMEEETITEGLLQQLNNILCSTSKSLNP